MTVGGQGAHTAAQPRAGSATQRLRWMDVFRGVAIILVLAWHAAAIPVLHGFPMSPGMRAAFDTLLPFRMPGLMLLSGMLLGSSFRKPLGAYYEGKIRALLWPYLIWAAIHIAQYGSPAPVWHWRTWWANGYLWFLFYVGLYYAIAPLVRRVPPVVLPFVALLLSFVTAWVDSLDVNVGPFDVLLDPMLMYFAIFFFAGHALASAPEALPGLLRRRWVIAVGALIGVALAGLSAWLGADFNYQGWTAPLSLAGLIAAIAGIRAVADHPALDQVASIGRSSIIPYVAHFPIMTVVVLLGVRLGVENIYVMGVIDFVVGMTLCTVLIRLDERAPVSWLFRWPIRLSR